MTKHSAPFSLSEKREGELVALGIAEFVEPSPEYSTDMKMIDLRIIAAALGIDAGATKSKKEVIAMIETAKDAAAEKPPTTDAAGQGEQ